MEKSIEKTLDRDPQKSPFRDKNTNIAELKTVLSTEFYAIDFIGKDIF